MTSFVGNATSAMSVLLVADDKRVFPGFMVDLDPFTVVMIDEPYLLFQYCTQWWPRGASLMGCGDEILEAVWMDKTELIEAKGGGTNSRFGIYGVTRDVWGAPLPGVIVKLFRTIGDLYKDVLIDETISSVDGAYFVSTPFYLDTHYLVMYKAGSPDVFGSSVNTLIGS